MTTFIESGRSAPELAQAYNVPIHLTDSLCKYALERRPIGGFLAACLANDFQRLMATAHITLTRENLQGVAQLIFNELPANSWGDYEIVTKWIEGKQPPVRFPTTARVTEAINDLIEVAEMAQEPVRDAHDQYHDWHDQLKAKAARAVQAARELIVEGGES